MLFPTVEFALFFFIVFFISWQLQGNWRKLFLAASSYFFYGFWNWQLAGLLFFCSTINYLCGLLLGRMKDQSSRKFAAGLAVFFNLGLLFFFKYFTFSIASWNNLLLLAGLPVRLKVFEILLPVGISFYTFQALSYVLDVYRGQIPVCRSYLDLLLYISFFPQLVAGPIVRAGFFLKQLQAKHTLIPIEAGRHLLLILSGVFKKTIIAHYLASLFIDRIFTAPAACSRLELLLGLYGYAVQIYCDFSAYSDIAIGVAGLLGFDFPGNFNHPYRACSLRDFWKRWHISLSTWLRDYLYIPLGGSKQGRLIAIRNLLLTMLLGGIWHGAAWRFLFWGAWHGLGLAGERLIPGQRADGSKHFLLKIFGLLLTFHFVCLGWVFFRAPNLGLAFEYLQALFTSQAATSLSSPFILILIGGSLLLHLLPEGTGVRIQQLFSAIPPAGQGILCGLCLIAIGAIAPEGIAPFIYFQF